MFLTSQWWTDGSDIKWMDTCGLFLQKSCQKAALVLQYLPQNVYQLWQAIKWNGSGFFYISTFRTRSLSFWLLPSQGHLTIFPLYFTQKSEKISSAVAVSADFQHFRKCIKKRENISRKINVWELLLLKVTLAHRKRI